MYSRFLAKHSVIKMMSKLTFVLLILVAAINVDSSRVKRYTQDQCGEPINPGGLISHGTISKKDQWPYLVALFNTVKGKFFCGASLISRSHILTAAHCLQEKQQNVAKQPSDVIAYLGKYDLSLTHERGSVAVYPSEFIIHADWKPMDAKYDADIAIIKIDQEVLLRSNIYPVCLWTSDLKSIRDEDGTVVGW